MKYIPLVNIKQGSKSGPRYSNGNTLPYVQLPFGMAGFVPQTFQDKGNWFFHPDDRCLEGIRLTHQPSPWMGDFGCLCLLPSCGEILSECGDRWSSYRPEEAVFRPDYLSLEFLRYQTKFELTPTSRGASIKVKYNSNQQPRFSVFPIHNFHGYKLDAKNRLLTGFTKARSWDTAENFALYFAMEFDCNINAEISALTHPQNQYEHVVSGSGMNCGYSVALENTDVNIKFAVSYISEKQAIENLKQDHENKDFDYNKSQAEKNWESCLSKIKIQTQDEDIIKTFYSCMYRTFLFPQMFHEIDKNGDVIHYCAETGTIENGIMYTNNGFGILLEQIIPCFQ